MLTLKAPKKNCDNQTVFLIMICYVTMLRLVISGVTMSYACYLFFNMEIIATENKLSHDIKQSRSLQVVAHKPKCFSSIVCTYISNCLSLWVSACVCVRACVRFISKSSHCWEHSEPGAKVDKKQWHQFSKIKRKPTVLLSASILEYKRGT